MRRARFIVASFSLLLWALGSSVAPRAARSYGECCYEAPQGPLSQNCNVIMIADDQITGCPGGDSVNVFVAGHPKWLRIRVHYEDNDCGPREGVPPESIWVKYKTIAGNLVLNDKGSKVFADDFTDIYGDTWITLKSFSGCGTIRCSLFVSGKFSGYKDRLVRTTDQNGNGRTEASEGLSPCDLNYDGNLNDGSYRQPHLTDWHRNVLHGTLVKRTSLCDTCALGNPNTLGTGDINWSPSGRRLVYSIFDQQSACRVFHSAADPSGGNIPIQLTFSAPDSHDYDPSWSPLGDRMYYTRADAVIYRKGIPGIAADTSEIAIHGDDTFKCCGTISPDGRTIAFSKVVSGRYTIWTVPTAGGAARQITAAGNQRDWYPKWSSDGQTLIFERRTLSPPIMRGLYTVPAFQDSLPTPTVFYESANLFSGLPSIAEDGAIVVAGAGQSESATTAHTLDATGTLGFHPIQNYVEHTTGNIFPRMSPDGTRLAMVAKNPAVAGAVSPQVWAARRNMNFPPSFTDIGGQSVADSTARVFFTMLEGFPYSFTVTASDPPDPTSDSLTYVPYYLQLGMTFTQATRTFSWTPPVGTANQTFHVKFGVTTASGGSDGIIAVISVAQALGPGSARASTVTQRVSAVPDGAGSVRIELAGAVPKEEMQLTVFDLAGRRLTRLTGRGGGVLRWDGRDAAGRRMPSGVYFFSVRSGGTEFLGRLVYLR